MRIERSGRYLLHIRQGESKVNTKTASFSIHPYSFDLDITYSEFSGGWYFYRFSDSAVSDVYDTKEQAVKDEQNRLIRWFY